MSATTLYLLSLTILFPLLAGLFRWKRVRERYYPLMALWSIGLVCEVWVWLKMQWGGAWIPINNGYILADSLLIPLQFFAWGFLVLAWQRIFLLSIILIAWFGFHVWPGDLTIIQAPYRMAYSLVIVLMTIHLLNTLWINERNRLARRPEFLLLTGFLVFYSYQLLYETAYVFTADMEDYWRILLNRIFSIINFACNILYGVAVCLIPANPFLRWRRPQV